MFLNKLARTRRPTPPKRILQRTHSRFDEDLVLSLTSSVDQSSNDLPIRYKGVVRAFMADSF